MTEHTPGPWTVDARFWVSVADDPDRLIADVYDGSHLSEGDRSREDEAVTEANAYLIAAAPDLLAATEKVLRHFGIWRTAIGLIEDYTADEAVIEDMVAALDRLDEQAANLASAIAKARGQAVTL